MFKPRPMQKEVLKFEAGWMGVSAVPGSGKTQTLSALAANLITGGFLQDGQEVLVVTLVNSAVDNFSRRVGQFVQEAGLLPNMGYRVRTLHGLAHDIVRERPALAGLGDDFQIADDRVADDLLTDAANAWTRAHPEVADLFFDLDLDEKKRDYFFKYDWVHLVRGVAGSFIRLAKDLEATPGTLHHLLSKTQADLPLVRMGVDIYTDYQRALAYRGAVDFDDLIRLALKALTLDQDYLQRLRARWPYILEDEAQDSSRLQEQILRLLAGDQGNWVRVGDPNQAIFETFTTASPKFLLDFLNEADIQRPLLNSGRSSASIIDLANYLVEWTRQEHPVEELRDALASTPIYPTPLGDPQPNPPNDPAGIQFVMKKMSPAEELDFLVKSVSQWLPEHADRTVAILVPSNDRGAEIVDVLKKRGIPCLEILRSTRSTREAAGALSYILRHLADPAQPARLAALYRVWRRKDREHPETKARMERIAELLRKCTHPEDFLWPQLGHDWLAASGLEQEDPEGYQNLLEFKERIQRWQAAALLPPDQIILTVAQDIFTEPSDLALAHKLANVLERAAAEHKDWRLPQFAEELEVVAKNERKFLGFSDDDTGFDPEQHRGKVVVATMHKAKGLEWDRVYLSSVNNYDFPSAQSHDTYLSEKRYIQGKLNLEAEALHQLKALVEGKPEEWNLELGEATRQARVDYAAERLRLLYVGITRARRELIISWNTGRFNTQQAALPLLALGSYWEERVHDFAE